MNTPVGPNMQGEQYSAVNILLMRQGNVYQVKNVDYILGLYLSYTSPQH